MLIIRRTLSKIIIDANTNVDYVFFLYLTEIVVCHICIFVDGQFKFCFYSSGLTVLVDGDSPSSVSSITRIRRFGWVCNDDGENGRDDNSC